MGDVWESSSRVVVVLDVKREAARDKFVRRGREGEVPLRRDLRKMRGMSMRL